MFTTWMNKGFSITFENGNTVSVQYGASNYISDRSGNDALRLDKASVDAEVAAWDKDGKWYQLGNNDDVVGWQTPAEVLAILNKAEQGLLVHIERENDDA